MAHAIIYKSNSADNWHVYAAFQTEKEIVQWAEHRLEMRSESLEHFAGLEPVEVEPDEWRYPEMTDEQRFQGAINALNESGEFLTFEMPREVEAFLTEAKKHGLLKDAKALLCDELKESTSVKLSDGCWETVVTDGIANNYDDFTKTFGLKISQAELQKLVKDIVFYREATKIDAWLNTLRLEKNKVVCDWNHTTDEFEQCDYIEIARMLLEYLYDDTEFLNPYKA